MNRQIRQAKKDEVWKVEAFLTKAGISPEGLEDTIEYFTIMESTAGELLACVGVEPGGKAGLLRSFVLSPQIDQQDILVLFEQVFLTVKSRALEELFLVTNKMSAVSFFSGLGFEMTAPSDLPGSLLEKNHLKKVLTVDNSAIMKIIL